MKWAALPLLAPLLALAGCSLGADEEPRPASGPARQAAAVVQQLERAVTRGDWGGICEDIFTAGARERAGGKDCPRLLRADAANLRRPRIEPLAITVKRDRAEVRVRSRAQGQPPLTDVIELRREGGEYRVEALAG